MNKFGFFCAASLLLSAGAATAQQVTPVAFVELDRYVGKWYEIARFPNRFQANCAGNVSAEYVKRADGRIDVINRCKLTDGSIEEAHGLARIEDPKTNAKLKVRFAPAWLSWLPFVWGNYWVLDLPTDYSTVAVGEPGRDYLWILARTPSLSEPAYQAIVKRVAAQGFDVGKLVKTVNE